MENSAQGTAGTLTRSVLWNYTGYFVEFAAGVLLLAYVVRRVSIADYGVFLLAQALSAFLYTLDFGLSNVSIQFYTGCLARDGIAKLGRAAGSLFIALLGAGVIGAILLNALAYAVPHFIHFPTEHYRLALRVLIFTGIAVAFDLGSSPLEHLCHTFHMFNRTNQMRVALVLLRVVLTLAVLRMGLGVVGLAMLQGLLSSLRMAVLWQICHACIPGMQLRLFSFDAAVIRDAFRMSKWAFGDDLARRLSMNAQSLILATFASVSQVAFFGLASKLPAHLYALAARGLEVTLPTFSHTHHKNESILLRRTYVGAFRLCLTGVLPIVVFAAICARPLVVVWAGTQYAGASSALAWLLASAFAQALMLPSDIVLYTHDHIRLAAKFSIVETVAKILLPLCLVYRFGAAGVAAGVALAHWFVHLGLYLPAACRVAHIKPAELWREALQNSTLLNAFFVVGVLVLGFFTASMGDALTFVACIATVLLYAGVWVSTTALGFHRSHKQELAQEVSR